jgi:hypothetical protein
MYRSGQGRITPLIRAGNVRWPWERYDGYPNRINHGSTAFSIRAEGETATVRRASRLELWRKRDRFVENRRLAPERRGEVNFAVHFIGPQPLEHPCGVVTRIMGHPTIKEVSLRGKALDDDAFATWQDACSTFVDVVVEHLAPGRQQGRIRYEYDE